MGGLFKRRAAGVLLLFALLVSVLVVSPAGAQVQQQPVPITVACGGTWHWVHNQTSATSGTLTALFSTGLRVVANTPSNSANLHYHITLSTGATLLSASDNVSGGKLLLSDTPVCETTTTSTSTSTTSTSTPPTSTSLP